MASPGCPVWPPPPPLWVRVHPGHVHIPAGSFTAAETGKVVSVEHEERRDWTWGKVSAKPTETHCRFHLTRKPDQCDCWHTLVFSLSPAWAWDNRQCLTPSSHTCFLPSLAINGTSVDSAVHTPGCHSCFLPSLYSPYSILPEVLSVLSLTLPPCPAPALEQAATTAGCAPSPQHNLSVPTHPLL